MSEIVRVCFPNSIGACGTDDLALLTKFLIYSRQHVDSTVRELHAINPHPKFKEEVKKRGGAIASSQHVKGDKISVIRLTFDESAHLPVISGYADAVIRGPWPNEMVVVNLNSAGREMLMLSGANLETMEERETLHKVVLG